MSRKSGRSSQQVGNASTDTGTGTGTKPGITGNHENRKSLESKKKSLVRGGGVGSLVNNTLGRLTGE